MCVCRSQKFGKIILNSNKAIARNRLRSACFVNNLRVKEDYVVARGREIEYSYCMYIYYVREMGVGCELLGFENFTGTHEPFATCKQFRTHRGF